MSKKKSSPNKKYAKNKKYVKKKSNKKLTNYKNILKGILEEYIDYDEDIMGVLKEQNGTHMYTSYGDYYLIEALMKEESDIKVW